jgi:hypothetical protein
VSAELFPGKDGNSAAYMSAGCAESMHVTEIQKEGLDPTASSYVIPSVQKVLDQCTVWGVPSITKIDPHAADPLESQSLKGLVMSVRFDAHTRSSNGEEITRVHLPATFLRVWNDRPHVATAQGHGGGDCAVRMIADFMNDPTKEPVSSCFEEARPSFRLPAL